MTDLLSTDQRRNGFKRLLKILSNRKLKKQQAVRKLIKPVKVRQAEEKELQEKEPIYSDPGPAASLVKQVVDTDGYPVRSKGDYLVRTDLEKTGCDLT